MELQELVLEAYEEQNKLAMDADILPEDTEDSSEHDHLLDDYEGLEGENTENLVFSNLDCSSEHDPYATDDVISYGNNGLENSLTIYFRDLCQHPLLTKEDEIYLFAQIERGRKMVWNAISKTHLGPNLPWDDMDRIIAEVRAIASDMRFLESIITCTNSGDSLTDSQITKLRQISENRPRESSAALATQIHIFSHGQTDALSKALLKELQMELGVTNGGPDALLRGCKRITSLFGDHAQVSFASSERGRRV